MIRLSADDDDQNYGNDDMIAFVLVAVAFFGWNCVFLHVSGDDEADDVWVAAMNESWREYHRRLLAHCVWKIDDKVLRDC